MSLLRSRKSFLSLCAWLSVLSQGIQDAEGCDLVPLQRQLERSWVIDTMDASSDHCLIQENCFSGGGQRTLLRFDSHVHNQGYSDCGIGWTPSCPRGDDTAVPDQYPFHYDTCHKHWHLTGFSRYTLKDTTTNQVVATGEKNGLCLMDVVCSGYKKFTCQNQGISAGCTDVYDKGLDCQWVDVTGLDLTKTYEFTWEINPARFIKETNFNNNILTIYVNLATVPRRSVRNSPAPNQCPRYSTLRSDFSTTRSSSTYTTTPTYGSSSYTTPTSSSSYGSGSSSYGTYNSGSSTYGGYSSSYGGYGNYGRYGGYSRYY